MTPSMLYDGLCCVQEEAGIDLNGGGDRDVAPALALIREFERLAMARALRWAAAHPKLSRDYYWPDSRLVELADAVAAQEEMPE